MSDQVLVWFCSLGLPAVVLVASTAEPRPCAAICKLSDSRTNELDPTENGFPCLQSHSAGAYATTTMDEFRWCVAISC